MPRTVLLVLVAVLALGAVRPAAPQLGFVDATPADLRELTIEVWGRFLAAFPARRRCLAPVTVAGERDLAERGRYLPDRRLVVVRVPGTADQLANALAHELAHHLESTCGEHAAFRPLFLAAMGRPAGTPWSDARDWEARPSEHFAEAVVLHVTGRRLGNTQLTLTPEAAHAVARWAVEP